MAAPPRNLSWKSRPGSLPTPAPVPHSRHFWVVCVGFVFFFLCPPHIPVAVPVPRPGADSSSAGRIKSRRGFCVRWAAAQGASLGRRRVGVAETGSLKLGSGRIFTFGGSSRGNSLGGSGPGRPLGDKTPGKDDAHPLLGSKSPTSPVLPPAAREPLAPAVPRPTRASPRT